MTEAVLLAAGMVLLGSMLIAYRRSGDPMHPLMLLIPMLLYIYVLLPANLYYRGVLTRFLGGEEGVLVAVGYSTAAAVMVALGCLPYRLPRGVSPQTSLGTEGLSPQARQRLVTISYLLGFAGLLVFLYQIYLAGGFAVAYGRAKGGGASIGSGYVNETPLLTIPAIILYLMGWKGRRFTAANWAILLAYAAPHLIQGTFGGRRGPAFLGFGALIFGWYLIRERRPKLRQILAALLVLGFFLLFLANFRQVLHLGSEAEFTSRTFTEILFTPSEEETGDTITMLGSIKAIWTYDAYQWGRGYVTQLLIRPIPRQLWPGKYEYLGMEWMEEKPGSGGLSDWQWINAVGWIAPAGSASGIAGDSFMQFSWGGLLLCWLVGNVYGYLWKHSLVSGGVWRMLYFEACVLSIYLPTQGLVSAWGYRLLYMSGATILFWRYLTSHGLAQVPRPDARLAPGSAQAR